ncbi:MAG TPA: nitrate- and nitrite sensing domain-containing protein, partial [Acidimicrobiales bacterium]|nr:nitrate- and nitrite sensing domain-containing protein [Acidimicrobiales bacterium]
MRRSRSIRTKLIALVALPMVALAVLAALGVRWSADAAERSRDAARRAEVAVASTAAALDVARERGLSVAVLGGQATGRVANPGHVTELRFQRGQTDVALDTLDAALSGGATTDLRAELDSLRTAVDGAGDGDGDGDGDGIVSSEALDRYTAIVEQLFATVATSIDAIDDPGLRDTARSYTGLTRATDAVTLQQTELMSGLV